MRTAGFACVAVVCASGADAFVGFMRPAPLAVRRAGSGSVRMAAEATVPALLKQTEQLKLLSTASKLGLLSKLEAAGLTLRDVEKLLPLVDEKDLIGLASGFGPDLLKVAPAALAAAPAALPLLAGALGVPPQSLYVGALASFAAGAGLVYVLPDDSVGGVALETFVAFPLLFVLPAVLGVAGFALSSLKNGTLVDFITSSRSGSSMSFGSLAPELPSVSLGPIGSGGRPVAVKKASAPRKAKAAPKAKPLPKAKAASKPKPAPKPVKPQGNIANIPKAL